MITRNEELVTLMNKYCVCYLMWKLSQQSDYLESPAIICILKWLISDNETKQVTISWLAGGVVLIGKSYNLTLYLFLSHNWLGIAIYQTKQIMLNGQECFLSLSWWCNSVQQFGSANYAILYTFRTSYNKNCFRILMEFYLPTSYQHMKKYKMHVKVLFSSSMK